jgi:adenine-specific DNA-methyltransferase
VAAIDDLIAQVEDKALRERLRAETDRLTKEKKFGLVFEEHLPELTPIYSARIRKGSIVARRSQPLNDLWRVISVSEKQAHCLQRSTGIQQTMEFAELVVVRQFGEPIFPALVPVDRVQNGGDNMPWHTLIEADNYHALQLLEYLYAGKVDCIYIDPPYNTGARDWKYNNDYVDVNDHWRHSKWLAMMRRRLIFARKLLNPSTGVMIVTIDEHEVNHLGMLLEQVFPDCVRQMVTIVINQKGVSQGRLARVEEYAVFVFMPDAFLKTHHDDLLSPDRSNNKRFMTPRWEWLLRGGNNSKREDRPGLFYPIYVDPIRNAVTGVGESLPLAEKPNLDNADDGTVAWPVRTDGSLGNWQVQPSTLRELLEFGYVRLGGFHKGRKTWTVQYLNKGTRSRIESGDIRIVARNPVTNAVEIEYVNEEARKRNIKTVWHRGIHDSGIYGSSVLRAIVGGEVNFAFPKSVYSVRDAIGAVTRDKPDALILDFFAGSGTSLHAIEMLNAVDQGNRRCILVTNNEVSEEEAKILKARNHNPGDSEWEKHGICNAVTWPRSKFAIMGKRDDGTVLSGEYLTGKMIVREKSRTVKQISFVDSKALDMPKKKQLVALIDGIPQTLVKADSAFVVSEKHSASILFDEAQGETWLEALDGQEQITDLYIVTSQKEVFDDLKAQIDDLLGPIITNEEEKRPMNQGFAANLEYFRLDFLDKDHVALGRQFREILPLLWLQSGAVGPRPELPKNKPLPSMLAPVTNRFAVLIDETHFADFQTAVAQRNDLTHLFLVTDSEEAFQEMAAQLSAPTIIQLYRDYLENFMINRGDEA